MFTNETTHYGIPLPLGSDLTTPMDYNEAAEKIDNEIFQAASSASGAVDAATTANTTANNAVTLANEAKSAAATASASASTALETAQNASNLAAATKQDLKDSICSIEEASATAAYKHEVDSYFWYNDTLYITTVEIPVGAQIVPNTNCDTTTITTELLKGGDAPVTEIEAEDVSFTDTIAQLGATDVQSAIVALKTLIDNIGGVNMKCAMHGVLTGTAGARDVDISSLGLTNKEDYFVIITGGELGTGGGTGASPYGAITDKTAEKFTVTCLANVPISYQVITIK